MSEVINVGRLSKFDAAILEELRKVEGNSNIKNKQLTEWTTGDIKPHEGEKVVKLPSLGINVAYKP